MSAASIEIIPYIYYRDVPAALEFLSRAFGFTEDMRVLTPSGMNAEMSLDGRRIMWGQVGLVTSCESPSEHGTATMVIFVYLKDVDTHHSHAAAADTMIERASHDESCGRTYGARDLEGHPWYFTTPPRGQAERIQHAGPWC
jgi:PhnB protein